jgi:hypothetical protein
MTMNGEYFQLQRLGRSTLSGKYRPFVRKIIATLLATLHNVKDCVDTFIFATV